MMKYINLFVLVILLGLFSCKSKENGTTDNPKNAKTTDGVIKGMISTTFADIEQQDSFKIIGARVEGNSLLVEVTYSGGCEAHEFKVYGSQAIAKSLPPIRSIKIVHDGKGDMCRALINQTLTIDIRDFAYKKEDGSQIYLMIDGHKEKVNYVYKK